MGNRHMIGSTLICTKNRSKFRPTTQFVWFFVYTSIQIPFFVAAWSVCQTDYKLCSCKRVTPINEWTGEPYYFMYKCKYIVCFLNVCFCFKNKLVMCYFNLQICTMHTAPKNPKNVHLFWEVCLISCWLKKLIWEYIDFSLCMW